MDLVKHTLNVTNALRANRASSEHLLVALHYADEVVQKSVHSAIAELAEAFRVNRDDSLAQLQERRRADPLESYRGWYRYLNHDGWARPASILVHAYDRLHARSLMQNVLKAKERDGKWMFSELYLIEKI